MVLGVRLVGARLPDVLGPIRAGTAATGATACGLLIAAVWGSPVGLLVATFVIAIGSSFLYPSLLLLALRGVPESQRGSVVGTFSAFFDFASGVAGISLGGIAALDQLPGCVRGVGRARRRRHVPAARRVRAPRDRRGADGRRRRDRDGRTHVVAVSGLLVTNDFPPKIGGIQSYLHELWRRLPVDDATVLTTRYDGGTRWDAQQAFRVVRAPERQFFPTASLARRIDALAREVDARVILLDPWLPLGRLGPRLRAAPYVVVVHGAEVTVPGRLPGTRQLGGTVLRGAAGVVAAGRYPAREAAHAAGRELRGVVVPPGVDVDRFRPLDAPARAATRRAFGLDPDRPLVLGVSRLVPRKGFDVLIDAVAGLPDVQLAIAGSGRDRRRLRRAPNGAGSRRACGSSDGSPTTTRSRSSTPAPTCSACRAATGGEASRPRVSASCSSRLRPPVFPRWRGAAAVRTRPWSTARPVSWSRAGRSTCAARSARCSPTTGSGADGGRRPGARDRANSPTSNWPPAWRRWSRGISPASGRCPDDRYARPVPAGDLDPELLARQGRAIIRWGWIANVVFALAAIPVAVGVDDALGVAIGVALLLFAVAVVAFVYAFAVGLARSTHGDDVAVANLFFLQGSAPKPIRHQFLGMFLVCLAIAVGTAAWEPFGVLVPMLPVGLAGVWAARYGVFPPRPVAAPRRRA